jgi:hypothetical protein
MKRLKAFLGASIPLALGVVFLGTASQSASAACQLGGQVKHVVYISFDNVHLRRDNPNIPSDLEQMPNLLNFIQNNGTISGNHHTPLISHTATDFLTTLTGVYGERMQLRLLQARRQRGLQQFIPVLDSAGRRWQARDDQ